MKKRKQTATNGSAEATESAPAPKTNPCAPVHSLFIQADQALMDRMEAQAAAIAASPLVRELGATVNADVVARIALLRGLEALEKSGFESAKVTQATSATVETAATAGAPEKTYATPQAAAAADIAEQKNARKQTAAGMKAEYEEDGSMRPPTWWGKEQQLRVSEDQAGIHAYYAEKGWLRWWADHPRSGKPFYFYWCPRLDQQLGVELYPGMLRQDVGAWGTAHIVPIVQAAT